MDAGSPAPASELDLGRESYAARAWSDAYDQLNRSDRAVPLGAENLELLASSAYMLGRDEEFRGALERAYRAHLAEGDAAAAARCAWWIGHNFLFHGESAPASGWFARGQRLLERESLDCVSRGYLLIPDLLQHVFGGDPGGAYAIAARVTAIGERFGDRDLVAIGLMEQGHALVRQGRTEDGLRLVDETMIAVVSQELSPIVAGIVYCNTIAFCRDVYELRRAREWTGALTRWCAQQPEMVTHQGLCLVHRAEIMTLAGTWQDALEEARRAGERYTQGALNERAVGHAAYRRGEVHRLRGELEAAEAAYREASRLGQEPLPGLALLRLAQGKEAAAAAAIQRALGETNEPLKRAALLPAEVETLLAIEDVEHARVAATELSEIAERQGSDVLGAMAAYARGAVALAEGDGRAALPSLRLAWQTWHELEAPYEAARARALAGLACRSLGDEDSALLELEAARAAFAQLGAEPDLVKVDAFLRGPARRSRHGLTARELEVLRLIAAGKSNHAIAADLFISEHTVRRHAQNIFRKLDVSSRAAATAFAFEHDLI